MLGYKLISDITVSTAQTSVSFTGLNITKDDDYLLVSDVVNTSGSASYYYGHFNGNTTATNYYMQDVYATSTTVGAGRQNFPMFCYSEASSKVFANTKIKLANSGYSVWQSDTTRIYGTSTTFLDNIYGTSTFTSSSITSLTVTASVSNAIGIGSRFRLYKLTAKKVADITVGTAVTSVDITGLSIDKGSEYMLVSDCYNPLGTDIAYMLFCNDNLTSTNYYNQLIVADGTSIGAGRTNLSAIQAVSTSKKGLAIIKIKLTNSGYFVCQSEQVRDYGTSSIKLQNQYSTSTFTNSNIAKLTFSGSSANGIGIGSRFQLYKLK